MAWAPQPQQLAQLAQCLHNSLSGHDPKAQKAASQMLDQAKSSPDINNYLTYLCVTPTAVNGMREDAWHTARTAAAIMLKNNVRTGYKTMPEASKAYMKSTILAGLSDSTSQVRGYVGLVVTEVVKQGGVRGWREVIPQLLAVIENADGQSSADAQDGAIAALVKICEDNKTALDQDHDGQRPLAFLLPKLLQLLNNETATIRVRALAAINAFLTDPMSSTAREHINEILPRIVALCNDSSEKVRRFVCRAFSVLADSMPAVLRPSVEGIVDFTLSQQKDIQNPELALDAAEFFFEASSDPALLASLGPYLDRIVPVLLDGMVYSEDDQVRLEDDEDDADEEDEEKDIKPQFATSKQARIDGNTDSTQPNGQDKPSINGYAYADDDDLSEGEIEDDDDPDIDPEDEWNLRKCSAASLDSLATKFGEPVFTVTLPWLQTNLAAQEWPNREAAVLALGAIGPGCMQHIKPSLPELVPFLIQLLTDQQPVVRQISCWALCRFAGWASQLDDAGKQQFFEPMMDGVLQRMLDSHKKVQESAASAFATLEESASDQLTPYCRVIVQQFVKCFGRYKDKNIYILYDCVQTLAEHTGPTLAQPELVDMLMPALITRWQKIADQSREMFPLLECLAFVATALGTTFAPYATPLWGRCITIIAQNLEDSSLAGEETFMQPDKDFLVTSLDLLSSIIQALEPPQSTELATKADPNLFLLLAHCMKDENNDVKQSAYALLGDCAIYIFPLLQQYLDVLMQILITQLDLSQIARHDPETTFRVINNACWSCGEIAMRHGTGMDQYIDGLLQKLAVIMFSDQVPSSLNENAAIAVGRLGIGCHERLAPHLKEFAQPFLKAMMKIGWTDEKGHAYKGFSAIVLDNPQAMENDLLNFLVEMASAPGVFLTGMQDDGPLKGFESVLRRYKELIGENWDQFLHHMPPEKEQALRGLYVF